MVWNMLSLTEILKNGEMCDNTRQALDNIEMEFFYGLIDTIKAYKDLDASEKIAELVDNDKTVRAVLIDLYNGIDDLSRMYNLKGFDSNSEFIEKDENIINVLN